MVVCKIELARTILNVSAPQGTINNYEYQEENDC